MPGNVGWPSPIVTYTVPDPRPMLRGESDTRRHRDGGRRHRPQQPGRARAARTPTAPSTTPARWPRTRRRLHDLASQGAQLVLTDTNRKQAFRWDTLTANAGYTETPEREPGQDRPERQPHRALPGHDHLEQDVRHLRRRGRTSPPAATATRSPTRPRTRPTAPSTTTSTRPGSPAPSCPTRRASGGRRSSPTRSRTDHITLVQPQRGDRSRWVSAVTLTFDGKDPVRYDLTPASHLTGRPDADLPVRAPSTPCGSPSTARPTTRRRPPRPPPSASPRSRSPASHGAPGHPDADPDAVHARGRLGRRPPHRRDDPPAHLAVPAAQRPRDDDHASVHAARPPAPSRCRAAPACRP